jgi:hypothetical protein
LVETRGSDVVVLALLALAGSALWTYGAVVGQPPKDRVVWSFLWRSSLFAGVTPALNGALDRHAPRVFTTIVSSKSCYRSTYTWRLSGVHGLPVETPTMTLQAFGTLDASPGDTLFLGIKPGFFGRLWIASRNAHKADPSRLPCARLTAAAASGDTAQIGMLLADGLSLEDEEPALNCEPPLVVASREGEVEAVKFLIDRGADQNHAASDGKTPLMCAVIARNLPIIKLLLAHGADPRAVLHQGPGWTKDVTGIALDVGDTAIIRAIANAIPHSTPLPSGH